MGYSSTEGVKFCPNCGEAVAGQNFCHACGAALVGARANTPVGVGAAHAREPYKPAASRRPFPRSAQLGRPQTVAWAAGWLGQPVKAACLVGWKGALMTQAASSVAGGIVAGPLTGAVGDFAAIVMAGKAADRALAPTAAGAKLTRNMAMIVTRERLLLVEMAGERKLHPRAVVLDMPLTEVAEVQVLKGGIRHRFRLRVAGQTAPIELEGKRGANGVEDVVSWLQLLAREGPVRADVALTCARCQVAEASPGGWCDDCLATLAEHSLGSKPGGVVGDVLERWNSADDPLAAFADLYTPDAVLDYPSLALSASGDRIKELLGAGPAGRPEHASDIEAVYEDAGDYWVRVSDSDAKGPRRFVIKLRLRGSRIEAMEVWDL